MSGRPPTGLGVTPSELALLAALHRSGGAVQSLDGRCSALLAELANVHLPTVGGLLCTLERRGFVLRDTRGRRTYEVILNDMSDKMLHAVERVQPPSPPPAAHVRPPENEPATMALATPNGHAAAGGAIDYGALADALLRAALDAASAPQETRVDARRLSDALEDNARLREKVNRLSEDASSSHGVIDKLRVQLKNKDVEIMRLNDNLRVLQDAGKRAVDQEVRERMDRFIRQRPEPGILARTGSD